MKLPNMPKGDAEIWVTVRAIIIYMRAVRIIGIAGGLVQESANGTTLFPSTVPGASTPTGGGSSTCFFGEIISVEDDPDFDKGIRGGIVYCGDKNFNVPFYGIELDSDSDKLIYLEIDCESNQDDDNEMILPGIKTSSETSADSFWDDLTWSEGADYPDNDNPDAGDGLGTIIIPIGRLTVKDGSAKLDAAGCGHVKIEQCGGILTHTRG